jgi:hypothetical protein
MKLFQRFFGKKTERSAPQVMAETPEQTATAAERFIEHSRSVWPDCRVPEPDGEILVDFSATPDRMIAWSYYANVLAGKLNGRLVAFSSRWKTPEERGEEYWKAFQAFNCVSYVHAVPDEAMAVRAGELAEECRREVRTKADVLRYRYNGIELGIDFYDSYLRYFNEATVDLGDPRFWETVKKGFGIYLFWEHYFQTHPVRAIFVTQPIYLRHGPLCHVAWSRGLPVLNGSLGGFWCDRFRNGVGTKFKDYPEGFRSLPESIREKGVAYARKKLQERLAGASRADLFYMNGSAFQDAEGVEIPGADSDAFKVVICSHDFYDNPRAQQGMIFEDYHEWLKFLGEYSDTTDYIWYIKVHPNADEKAWQILRDFAARYKKFVLVPKGVSHHQLVRSGVRVCLTCYGTVAFEYPLMGIPVINASSNNPNIAYDFCHHARNPGEYLAVLQEMESLKVPDNLESLYENFFMHHFPDRHANFFIEGFLKIRREIGIKKVGSGSMFHKFIDGWTPERHRKLLDWTGVELDKMLVAESRYTTQKTEVDEAELNR